MCPYIPQTATVTCYTTVQRSIYVSVCCSECWISISILISFSHLLTIFLQTLLGLKLSGFGLDIKNFSFFFGAVFETLNEISSQPVLIKNTLLQIKLVKYISAVVVYNRRECYFRSNTTLIGQVCNHCPITANYNISPPYRISLLNSG